jgi:hypothetical protein
MGGVIMNYPEKRTWAETLRAVGASMSPRYGRRMVPRVEAMEGRVSLSALLAGPGATRLRIPQPDPPTRWHPVQASREASIAVLTATAVHWYTDPNQ